ncbi:MAG: UDP-N-acetylglucosamine--LPS N-acetylglucosamine transferase [Clostridiales bacterium]|nr:UDP-N-acetylglucosamine--LPS N-acetylglucosamine transferase [Clostridiales bacterium]
MHKNIIIISSDFTGHGHKSITTAITEQLENYPEIKVHVIDGFSLSGSLGLKIGKMYGTITRASKDLWKMIWELSYKKPSLLIDVTETSIRSRFTRLLKTVNPDAIIVTHPNYYSSVINVLEGYPKKIPVYSIVADPVSISPLWCDARAEYTLCPTLEAKEACMSMGVPEEKIKVFGWPVRKRFREHLEVRAAAEDYNSSRPVNFTVMSGGEGSGNMGRIVRILAKNFNCKIKVVCGRNKLLKKRLEYTLPEKYSEKVEILGFVNDIQNLMLESDIMFTRASPNTFMEAVMCNAPLVITGALPGQEEGNPDFVEKYNLGVVSRGIRQLKHTVQELLENDAAKLNGIKKSQRDYRQPDSVKNIVEFILNN